jgi:hypothetical protein
MRVGLGREADRLLEAVEITPLGHSDLSRATRLLPAEVRRLDAIHLEAAIRLHETATISAALTHDKQLRDGYRHHDIPLAS